jgi:hypothetical protein
LEIQDKARSFKIIDPAVLPLSPVSPDRVKIILIGIVAGLASAFGILIFLDRSNPAIRSVSGLKEMGVPVMAVIPRILIDEDVSKERKGDVRLYRLAGCYFGIILFVLLTEAVGYSVVDKVASALLGV